MFRGIASIIFLGAALLIFFTLSQPLYGEIQVIEAQKYSLNESLSGLKQAQERRNQLASQYNQISKDNLERLDKVLPAAAGSMKYVSETEALVKKYGMLLKNIDFEEKTGNNVSLSLKFTGPYESFYSFLKDVGSNIRLTDVNSIDFSSGETNSYEFTIGEVIYWKKPATSTEQDVLSLLNTINLNLDFFENPVFKSLNDFSIPLSVSPAEVGKNNPFAP